MRHRRRRTSSSGALTVREDPLRSSLELEILVPDGIIWFLGQPIHVAGQLLPILDVA